MFFMKPTCKNCGDYLYEKHKKLTAMGQHFGRPVQQPIIICHECNSVMCMACVEISTSEKHPHMPYINSNSVCLVCKADAKTKVYDDHKGKVLCKHFN